MQGEVGGLNTYTGMGGWDLFPFNGLFYPPKQGKGFRKLAFYSHYFDCVEVNATFYNASFSPRQIGRWLSDVTENERFLFTVKLFRGFTHTFTATQADVGLIARLLDQLEAGGRLGGLIMQFPVSFKHSLEHRRRIAKIARAFGSHKIFVELRHKSWNIPSTLDFLQDQRAYPVNVDLPPLPDHMPFTSWNWGPGAYFRMMGRNAVAWRQPWRLEPDGKHMVSDRYNYCYQERELLELGAKVVKMNNQGATFVIFHNDPEGNSLYNGFQLRRLLSPEHPPDVPKRLVQVFPSLAAPRS
jgi:uncharacterized protein YecE (DUF72 family)